MWAAAEAKLDIRGEGIMARLSHSRMLESSTGCSFNSMVHYAGGTGAGRAGSAVRVRFRSSKKGVGVCNKLAVKEDMTSSVIVTV